MDNCKWTDNMLYESLDSVQWEYLKKWSIEPIPDKTLYIVERMMEIWPDSIKPSRVYKPNISCQELIGELVDYVPDCDYPADYILARIIRFNEILQDMSLHELYGKRHHNTSIHEKARHKLFFLHLDCRYPPKKWAAIVTSPRWKTSS